jgi:hypothetical protein
LIYIYFIFVIINYELINERYSIQSHFYKKIFFLFLALAGVSSCDSIPYINKSVISVATKALIKANAPKLELYFLNHSPILAPEQSRFQTVDNLPGSEFNPNLDRNKIFNFSMDGKIIIESGDYVIPVTTYCMKADSSSPAGHSYLLSKMLGSRANIIKNLNIKTLPKYSQKDVQILSWSLQAGLSYEDMTEESKKIIDDKLLEFKSEIQESFIIGFEKQWNDISAKSSGMIPSFADSSDELLLELGDVGRKIIKARDFREMIKQVGNNYSSLSQSILVSGADSIKAIKIERWSKISDRVFAKFIIEGGYQEIGYLKIRVLPESRGANSILSSSALRVDISSWLADPDSKIIQPLSFSPIIGIGGIVVLPTLIDAPLASAIVIGAILAAKVIDWKLFDDLYKMFNGSEDKRIQKNLDKGLLILSKAHDELEKPLRDAEIISKKTKNSSKDKDNETREYSKSGGDEELSKDFDRLPGEASRAKDGTEIKTLPDGKRAVKRLESVEQDKKSTLEIQPPNIKENPDSGLRIKVRYPKHED